MDMRWDDIDPETGKRRYIRADRFAGVWSFKWKLQRRGDWTKDLTPTREMWEQVLDTLERRYWRREGVEEADITQVKTILKELIRKEELRNS